MRFNDTDLMIFLLKYINFIGFNPRNRTNFTNILAAINYTLMLILLSANIIEVIMNFDGADTLEKLTFTAVLLVTIRKSFWWILQRKKINKALDLIDKMWPLDKFGLEDYEINLKRIKFSSRMMKIYAFDFYGTTLGLAVYYYFFYQTLIIPGFYGCDIADKACFQPLFFTQLPILFYVYVPGELSFDCFFFAIITFFYIAADQIKKSFRMWNKIKDLQESKVYLRKILEQHIDLLEFFGIIKELFGELLFLQIAATIFNMTFALYLMTIDGFPPSLESLLLFSFLYTCYALQVGNLCFGGTIVSNQMETIAVEAYNTDWYNQPTSQAKSLAMIIKKAQLSRPMMAGSLIPLNLDTFTNVVTYSFKLCAAIRTITELK